VPVGPKRTLSSTVALLTVKSRINWKVREIPKTAIRSVLKRVRLCSRKRTRPLSGVSSPLMMFSRVVFPGAVGTDDGFDGAGLHLETDPVQGLEPFEGLGNPADLQQCPLPTLAGGTFLGRGFIRPSRENPVPERGPEPVQAPGMNTRTTIRISPFTSSS